MRYPKAWFEMRQERRRKLDAAVWIPLRASQYLVREREYGDEGNLEEFFGVGTLAVPLAFRETAEKLGWMDVGIGYSHKPFVDESGYTPADVYRFRDQSGYGTHLVLENNVTGPHEQDWMPHPDLVLGFGLILEGDHWVSPADGYEKVIEIRRDHQGRPTLVAMKAEYLKDYLAARDTALYVTSYRSRREISQEADFAWPESEWEKSSGIRWEGRVSSIHEGGMPFGGQTAVIHVAHKDFDGEQDVPVLPHPVEGEYESRSWKVADSGRQLQVVNGELWKEEWVEPAPNSPRIRGDKKPSTASFIVDASGHRRSGDALTDEGRWLWFRPEVIPAIAHRRSGELTWYTEFTGGVVCVPSSRVHFGVNKLGLVNVYAKDIGYLPDWQQRIWAAHNVTPEGGVSEELQAAQIRGEPANTMAPEPHIVKALNAIRELSTARFSVQLVQDHHQLPEILERTHRFRAVDDHGLFALAKDLARVTADLFDVKALNAILGLEGDGKVGSLKGMERLLAQEVGSERAHSLMGPLFGIYELRLGDAHLPKEDQQTAFELVRVDRTLPLVHQGWLMIASCVTTLYSIAETLEQHDHDDQSVVDDAP